MSTRALPPHAVVDYLQRICDLRRARLVDSNQSELILGVCGTDLPLYNGLEHYLYYLDGKIYSWGDTFDTVEEAALQVDSVWTVGWRIAVS